MSDSSDKDSEKDEEDGDGIASMLGLQSYWDATYSDELENFRQHGHAGEIWYALSSVSGAVFNFNSLLSDLYSVVIKIDKHFHGFTIVT